MIFYIVLLNVAKIFYPQANFFSGFGVFMSNGYKKLDVWNLAYKLSLNIYRITKNFPKDEIYGLRSQIRRSSVSIIANLAEGHGKFYPKEFIRYISISIGSCNELEVHIMLARDLNYISENEYSDLIVKHEKVSKMLTGLRKGLKKRLEDSKS
jgi:four helix bundle protein